MTAHYWKLHGAQVSSPDSNGAGPLDVRKSVNPIEYTSPPRLGSTATRPLQAQIRPCPMATVHQAGPGPEARGLPPLFSSSPSTINATGATSEQRLIPIDISGMTFPGLAALPGGSESLESLLALFLKGWEEKRDEIPKDVYKKLLRPLEKGADVYVSFSAVAILADVARMLKLYEKQLPSRKT